MFIQVHKTAAVQGMTIHYWIYQVKLVWKPKMMMKETVVITEQSLQATEPIDAVRPPVILINGGPGYPHNYMLPLKVKFWQKSGIAFLLEMATLNLVEGVGLPGTQGYLLWPGMG